MDDAHRKKMMESYGDITYRVNAQRSGRKAVEESSLMEAGLLTRVVTGAAFATVGIALAILNGGKEGSPVLYAGNHLAGAAGRCFFPGKHKRKKGSKKE